MSSSQPLPESLDVDDNDVEVLDNIEMSVEDSMESESVIFVENLSDNPDDTTLLIGSGSDINHLGVEVNNDDVEIVAIDNTEVIKASDNETVDKARDVSRPSTSRPRPGSRRKRCAVNSDHKDHNHVRRQPKYGNDASDDSDSDAEISPVSAIELIRLKLSRVKAGKRPYDGHDESDDSNIDAETGEELKQKLNLAKASKKPRVAICDSTAAKKSHPSESSVGEASHVSIQGHLGEIARLRQELASSIRKSSKYDNLIAVLQARVACPVCYEVPKQAPVPVCSNGHVVCQACKRDTCPTCRVRMGVATSVLAVTVMENIPHFCQFQLYGCQETCSLGTLPSHQAVCKYRTVKCPHLNCDQRVPLSELVNHTRTKCVCFATFLNSFSYKYIITANIFEYNRRNFGLKPNAIVFDGKDFFFKVIRKSIMSMWYFYVQMAGGMEETKLYTVTIHVFKTSAGPDGKNSHRFIGDVCPIDKEGLDTAAEAGYCCELTDAQMKRLCTEELAGGERKFSFSVKVKIEVEDLAPREAINPTENNQTGDTTSDEELVLSVSGDISSTRVPRSRRHS